MMNSYIRVSALAAIAALAFTACSVKEDAPVISSEEEICYLPAVITIDPGNDDTRATYSFESGRMRLAWEVGDKVYCAPAAKSGLGCNYYVPEGGAATNTFVAERMITSNSKPHLYYYPGELIHNDATFLQFSYTGQVQRKSAPTEHIRHFHSIRKCIELQDYSTDYDISKVSFAGCEQSGCLKFDLSGATFVNPTKITLEIFDGSKLVTDVLYNRNYMYWAYNDPESGEVVDRPSHCSSLSLGLEGYGTETHLVAYMMHTCEDMNLNAGYKIRVTVYGDDVHCSEVTMSSNTAIKGGYYSTLTIDGGWKTLEGDYTEYEWDGDVVTLQNPGSNLDLVIMGDGFIKEDFDDGTYDSVMRQAYQDFFSVEPYNLFKDDFNVFYVKAPSPQRLDATNTGANGANNSGNVTKFSVQFSANSTSMSGNSSLAREYAQKAFSSNASERIKNATIIVVANQHCHAGTCYTQIYSGTDYGCGSAVAYVTLGSSREDMVGSIHHEAGGHGFGKLADEYTSNSGSFNIGIWDNYEKYHSYGFYRNADKYVTQTFNNAFNTSYALTADSEVLWYDMFGTDNHYESPDVESLGIFEGAATYKYGMCRPTENPPRSIMNTNRGIFNAISRRTILYRIRSLQGEVSGQIFGTPAELNYFLSWDAQYFLPTLGDASAAASSREAAAAEEHVSPLDPVLPYAPPVIEFCE